MHAIARNALTSLGFQLDDCGNADARFWLKVRMDLIFNRFLRIRPEFEVYDGHGGSIKTGLTL